jgi:hypothetical protein
MTLLCSSHTAPRLVTSLVVVTYALATSILAASLTSVFVSTTLVNHTSFGLSGVSVAVAPLSHTPDVSVITAAFSLFKALS